MTEVIQNQANTITVILSDASSGAPKTGVTASDITMFYRKDGGSPIEKAIDSSNFREISLGQMPGLYEVDFTAEELDTLGEFVATIQQNGSISLAQANISLVVVEDEENSPTIDYQGQIKKGQPHGFSFPITNQNGDRVSGLTSDDILVNLIKDGGSAFAQGSTGNISELTGTGIYNYTLTSSNVDITGDLLVSIENQWGSPQGSGSSTTAQSSNTSSTISSVYNRQSGGQEGFLVTMSGELHQTSDGGATWSAAPYSPLPGPLYDVDGDDGESTSLIAFVGQNTGTSDPFIGWGYGPTLNTETSTQGSGYSKALSVLGSTNKVWIVTEDGAGDHYIESFTPGFSNPSLDYSAASSETLRDIYVLSINHIVAVGADTGTGEAIAVISEDGGSTWATVSLGNAPGNNFHRVDFIDDSKVGWAVGKSGIIYVTFNGGQSWTKQDGGNFPDITWYGVYAHDEDHVYVSGYDNVNSVGKFVEGGYNGNFSSVPSVESEAGTNELRTVDGIGSQDRYWTAGQNGEIISTLFGPGSLAFDHRYFRFSVVDNLESDTYSLVNTVDGKVDGIDSDVTSIQSDITTVDGKVDNLDSDVSAVDNTVNVNQQNINDLLTDVDEVKGSSFAQNTDSLEALRNIIDNRIPSDVALKKHLGNGTGTVDAPVDTGIWDILGDGGITLSSLESTLDRILGLVHENFVLESPTFDSSNNMIGATIKTFPTKSDAQNDTNKIASYTVSATYDSDNNLTKFEMVED